MTAFDAAVQADTIRWLERAVIGLNLCPFAKAVHVHGQIGYVVYAGTEPAELMALLLDQAQALVQADPAMVDTTLLIAPQILGDFLAFNDWMRHAQRRMHRAGHEGVLQLLGFHPQFQFADAEPEDVGNLSNRSPYPTLHLLREASVGRAVAAFPDAADIFERNIQRLRELGPGGWQALDVGRHGAMGVADVSGVLGEGAA